MKSAHVCFAGLIFILSLMACLTCSDVGKKIPEGTITLRITGLSGALDQQKFEDIRSRIIISLINKSDYSISKE